MISRHAFSLIMSAALLGAGGSIDPLSAGGTPPWEARWVWLAGAPPVPYNQTVIARRSFDLAGAPRAATMRVTADSFYRLEINGRWVNDGPCRSWPEHFQYDEIEVAPYLCAGRNEIRIVARHYGSGDFHRVPKRAGLLAQLDIVGADGARRTIGTDAGWEIARAAAWVSPTPKVSIQMAPCEYYDARLEGELAYAPAEVLFPAEGGPWKDLNARDVALMTRRPFPFRSFLGARMVRAEGLHFCLPAARLIHPGLIEANRTTSLACGMATVLKNERPLDLSLDVAGFKVSVDGRRVAKGAHPLAPGEHLVLALAADIFGHQKEKSLRLRPGTGFALENPLGAAHGNPWCFLRFPEFAVARDDLLWDAYIREDARIAGVMDGWAKLSEGLMGGVKDRATFGGRLGDRAAALSREEMFVEDPSWMFEAREVVGDAGDLVIDPGGLMHDNAGVTVVHPPGTGRVGDIELAYDLGEQNCGYYQFELMAPAGVILDIHGIEHITPDGRLQHTRGNRNGMRYITREGVNRFTSLKRRSGRFVYLTLRGVSAPVRIRNFQLIESTYPIRQTGWFACSDARLERIWEISTRTLKLCMEDSFTDCPLYEQTLWVGDARNESLFAYGIFGAEDLARRCVRIAGESLERYPIVGCQVPSCWDCLLPAWSFLWGISVWDHYWHTGDREFLRRAYPLVLRNIEGAAAKIDGRDLFAAPYWNLFDWTKIDQRQRAVLHNSMFFVGALDAALRAGEAIGEGSAAPRLRELRARLVAGVNRLWDGGKRSYPDSIRDDGSVSPSTCQHTSFLALLYDIVPGEHRAAALANLTDPPAEMVRIGSPFAVQYLYETFEKMGMEDRIVEEIYRNYLPMLEAGATTVWESFPSGTTGGGVFPTRSHCHAWSSAPSYFLNRIVLGIRATAPGGARVEISPRLCGLDWARGATATARGPVTVEWKVAGEELRVRWSAPPGVDARFVPNASHGKLRVKIGD